MQPFWCQGPPPDVEKHVPLDAILKVCHCCILHKIFGIGFMTNISMIIGATRPFSNVDGAIETLSDYG